MGITYTLVFSITVILFSVDSSLEFECLPDGEPITGVFRGESSSSKRNSLARYPASGKSSSPEESSIPDRSKSPEQSLSPSAMFMEPPTKIDVFFGLQCELNQLELFRITSYHNTYRVFGLRRYVFPVDKRIRLLARMNLYVPMPAHEQIVLSTADDEAFAILMTSNILVGIYSSYGRKSGLGRAKIKMGCNMITQLTSVEKKEIPVGRTIKMALNYRVERVNPSFSPQ